MGGYPNFCGIYMFDDFNKCADLPPLSRNQQKALKRKNKQINMSNDQNMSPQHSTKNSQHTLFNSICTNRKWSLSA